MLRTVFGIVIDGRLVQLEKVPGLMASIVFGSVTDVSEEQLLKA